jgi:hypothetical protein
MKSDHAFTNLQSQLHVVDRKSLEGANRRKKLDSHVVSFLCELEPEQTVNY